MPKVFFCFGEGGTARVGVGLCCATAVVAFLSPLFVNRTRLFSPPPTSDDELILCCRERSTFEKCFVVFFLAQRRLFDCLFVCLFCADRYIFSDTRSCNIVVHIYVVHRCVRMRVDVCK